MEGTMMVIVSRSENDNEMTTFDSLLTHMTYYNSYSYPVLLKYFRPYIPKQMGGLRTYNLGEFYIIFIQTTPRRQPTTADRYERRAPGVYACANVQILTDCDFGVRVRGVGHRVEYGPISVGGHGHQAEYGHCAQDDYQRHGEHAQVQVTGQPDAGQHGARYAHQTHQQVGDRQRHNVVVGAPAETSFLVKGHNHQPVADGCSNGHQALENGVRHVQLSAVSGHHCGRRPQCLHGRLLVIRFGEEDGRRRLLQQRW